MKRSVRIPGPVGWLLDVDTPIPNRWSPALQAALWGAAPFVFFLAAVVEGAIAQKYWVAAICAVLFFVSIGVVVHWDTLLPPRWRSTPKKLEYLRDRDTELGAAIRDMVWRSAWGRWFSAQVFINGEQPASEETVFHAASHLVTNQLVNGDLEVRGRLPNNLDYEAIPRTHWRSSALHFVRDPVSLWRMIVIPRGGAAIDPSGTVTGHDPAATQRTNVITTYDSMLVDAYQFEKMWPRRDRFTDRKRRKLLKQARKRGLDNDEIARLSQD
jgi:hypothetical protein